MEGSGLGSAHGCVVHVCVHRRMVEGSGLGSAHGCVAHADVHGGWWKAVGWVVLMGV